MKYRIVARYVYPEIQSGMTFPTKDEAYEELKRWKKKASDDGMKMYGRIVKEEEE